MDETFVAVAPDLVAKCLANPRLWRQWWPQLTLSVDNNRGVEGIQWSVAGELDGSAEMWLEPWHDGVIVHWFLRAEPCTDRSPWWRRRPSPERLQHTYVTSYKRCVHALKDALEAGRPPGVPPSPDAGALNARP